MKKDNDTNVVPNVDAMKKDIAKRFVSEIKTFDSLQVHLIKDGKSIANASMKNEDIIMMRELFEQDMADITANLLSVLKEQLAKKSK